MIWTESNSLVDGNPMRFSNTLETNRSLWYINMISLFQLNVDILYLQMYPDMKSYGSLVMNSLQDRVI